MGFVICVLMIICACLAYSDMENKERALKAESELAKLKQDMAAKISSKNFPVPEKKILPNPQPVTVSIPPPAQAVEPPRDDNPTPQDRGRINMEKLKETDPERYAAIVERMNNFTKQMHENSTKQVDFLKKLDTKSMTPEQLDNHNKLIPLVAKNNQLLYEISQNPEGENASNQRRELFDNSHQMRDLLDTERSTVLQQFATQLGYHTDQTAQFEEYIKYVYDMTSSNPFRVGGGGRGGGDNRGQQAQPNRQ